MASKKKMNISVDPEQVVYSQISKSQDGYNSARMVVKSGEKEYMAISYEWEGEGVPDFVMGMMGFMQANALEVGKEYEAGAAKKKGENPFKKKDEDMEDEEDPKDKKKKDKKKEKSGDGSQVHCKNCKKTKDKCDCGNWQPVPYKTKDQKENKTK